MAKMAFHVSKKEFVKIVHSLAKRSQFQVFAIKEYKAGAIVDFLYSFMIDMKNEDKIAVCYSYELVIDGKAIPLDELGDDKSTKYLRELVASVL